MHAHTHTHTHTHFTFARRERLSPRPILTAIRARHAHQTVTTVTAKPDEGPAKVDVTEWKYLTTLKQLWQNTSDPWREREREREREKNSTKARK